jgi:hypothetical protein
VTQEMASWMYGGAIGNHILGLGWLDEGWEGDMMAAGEVEF